MAAPLVTEMNQEDEDWTKGNNFPLVPVNKGVSEEAAANGLMEDQQDACRPGKEGDDSDEKGDGFDDIQCGILSWRPRCLRRFNNPQWLLFFFSLYALSLGKTS